MPRENRRTPFDIWMEEFLAANDPDFAPTDPTGTIAPGPSSEAPWEAPVYEGPDPGYVPPHTGSTGTIAPGPSVEDPWEAPDYPVLPELPIIPDPLDPVDLADPIADIPPELSDPTPPYIPGGPAPPPAGVPGAALSALPPGGIMPPAGRGAGAGAGVPQNMNALHNYYNLFGHLGVVGPSKYNALLE